MPVSFANPIPNLLMTLRPHLSTCGVALGIAAASMTAYAVTAPGYVEAVAVTPSENEQFALNCLACHGADLRGVPGLGANLVTSKFVGSKSVPDLVGFLKVGRLPDDPASVSGRPMPGFAWISEGDLTEIATYVKSRHGS